MSRSRGKTALVTGRFESCLAGATSEHYIITTIVAVAGKSPDVARIIEHISKDFGRLDILINI